MKTVLITGAAGDVGSHLRRELAGRYTLRVSDIKPIKDLRKDERYVRADVSKLPDMLRATKGVDALVHLGAWPVEGDWPLILASNIVGAYNGFEAARRNGVKRVIFASSNHAVGFYRRDQTIDHRAQARPDSRYGVSKAFGEALGALYADKYGLEVLAIRIGNVNPEPLDRRRLAIWISPRDIAQLVSIGIDHPGVKFEIVYGISDNQRAWYDNSNAYRLGYRPQDKSEAYAAGILAKHVDNSNPLVELYQGGTFVAAEDGGDPSRAHLVSGRAKRAAGKRAAKKRAAPKKKSARKK
jgi:uronate dehydrogenase